MDFNAIYHFLFESVEGVGILVIGGMVLSVIAAVLFEIRTRRKYRNHEVVENDEWSTFDDAEKSRKKAEIRKYKNDESIKEKNRKAAEEAVAKMASDSSASSTAAVNKPIRKVSSAPKTSGNTATSTASSAPSAAKTSSDASTSSAAKAPSSTANTKTTKSQASKPIRKVTNPIQKESESK